MRRNIIWKGCDLRESEARYSPSITVPLDSTPDSPEALQTALAAGHMRVAAYYQDVIHKQSPQREQRQGLQDVVPIIAAIRHLCSGCHWQSACDLLFKEGLHESMVQWGAWNALIGLYIALLPPFGVLVRRDEGLVCSHVGMLYGRLGEYQQCLAYFEQALNIQRQIGDLQGEISTLTNQGERLRIRGEGDLARAHFERALSLNKKRQDPLMQCVLLHNLGLFYHGKQDYQQASNYYTESLRLAYRQKELQGRQHTGMILTNLGMLFYGQDLLQEALAILLTALQLRQTLRDPTVDVLELFLAGLEQKMGSPAYTTLRQEALAMQQQVFSRLVTPDVQQ